jgi:hypothetical protein
VHRGNGGQAQKFIPGLVPAVFYGTDFKIPLGQSISRFFEVTQPGKFIKADMKNAELCASQQ